MVIELRPKLHTDFKKYCDRYGVTMRSVIEELIEERLDKEERGAKFLIRRPTNERPAPRPA